MRVLVTGGAGYLGSHTCRLLLDSGHEVWAYDNLTRGHSQAAPLKRLIHGDIGDGKRLEEAVRQHSIEAVIHFAAYTYVGESVQRPDMYYANNLVNTLTLLDAMGRAQVNRLVFSSTAAVYGNPEKVPITEDEPLKPINPYGRAKLAVEGALADYASAFGLQFIALRYFNASGAHPSGMLGEDHDPETHLIPLVLHVAMGKRPFVDVFGSDYETADGTCVRDYIHVDDLAAAHLAALQRLGPRPAAYNLGSGRGYSVREVIKICEQITHRPIPCRNSPRRPGDPPTLIASSERAERELEWLRKYNDLGSIVETAWKWHASHPDGYGQR